MNEDYIDTPTMGEIIVGEFLKPMNITPYRLSKGDYSGGCRLCLGA